MGSQTLQELPSFAGGSIFQRTAKNSDAKPAPKRRVFCCRKRLTFLNIIIRTSTVQNPFKGPRERSLAAEITASRVRLADLGRELADAETLVATKQTELVDLHVQGISRDSIVKASAAVAAAESEVKGKLGAITKIEATIASKEAELAVIIDGQTRAATAKTLDARLRRFRAVHADALKVLAEYAVAARDLVPVVPEAQGLEIFADNLVRVDLPNSERHLGTVVESYILAVKNGTAPAALQATNAPTPKPVAEPEPAPTMRLYTLRPIKWCEPSNRKMIRYHAGFASLDLPPDLAQNAIAKSLAVLISDPRVADLRRHNPPKQVGLEGCEWIGPPAADEPMMVPNGERILHSRFDEHHGV
jgi:hypothetical protein